MEFENETFHFILHFSVCWQLVTIWQIHEAQYDVCLYFELCGNSSSSYGSSCGSVVLDVFVVMLLIFTHSYAQLAVAVCVFVISISKICFEILTTIMSVINFGMLFCMY